MTIPSAIIRQLAAHEFEDAYRIVVEAAAWLQEQRLPWWLISAELYQQHQLAGMNYGIFDGGKLCAPRFPSTGVHPSRIRHVSG
jgi:hypothetical protein